MGFGDFFKRIEREVRRPVQKIKKEASRGESRVRNEAKRNPAIAATISPFLLANKDVRKGAFADPLFQILQTAPLALLPGAAGFIAPTVAGAGFGALRGRETGADLGREAIRGGITGLGIGAAGSVARGGLQAVGNFFRGPTLGPVLPPGFPASGIGPTPAPGTAFNTAGGTVVGPQTGEFASQFSGALQPGQTPTFPTGSVFQSAGQDLSQSAGTSPFGQPRDLTPMHEGFGRVLDPVQAPGAAPGSFGPFENLPFGTGGATRSSADIAASFAARNAGPAASQAVTATSRLGQVGKIAATTAGIGALAASAMTPGPSLNLPELPSAALDRPRTPAGQAATDEIIRTLGSDFVNGPQVAAFAESIAAPILSEIDRNTEDIMDQVRDRFAAAGFQRSSQLDESLTEVAVSAARRKQEVVAQTAKETALSLLNFRSMMAQLGAQIDQRASAELLGLTGMQADQAALKYQLDAAQVQSLRELLANGGLLGISAGLELV